MITYQQAGVSIDAAGELVRRIKKIVSSSPFSASAIGGFSGLFPLSKKYGNFYLAGCCDGVGTKLKLAFLLDVHHTVGIDLVAMNVNDLICAGAQPLFFLDYFACGELNVRTAEKVIQGIQKGCQESGCALLGGETAQMPGFYKKGEYDLAGFAVGIVERQSVMDGKKIREGDCVVGLASSGVHSNGFSLIRKIFSSKELVRMGKELLAPTRIYVRQVLNLLATGAVKGMAHITGGGWIENIPRVLPQGMQVKIRKKSWEIPEIFFRIQKRAGISEHQMFRTYNMGIGMVLIIDAASVGRVMPLLKNGRLLGHVTKGRSGVVFT